MCQATPPHAVSRIRSIESVWACCSNDSSSCSSNCGSHMLVGPATRALEEERMPKRRRVVSIGTDEENNEARDANTADLFASLVDSNGEDAFPTIAWVFDDDEDDVA